MTTAGARVQPRTVKERFRLPDPPTKHPDDMTSFDHLAATGNAHNLAIHLGNPETTIVTGEHYVVVRPTRTTAGSFYPDLLIAFNANPEAYQENNGYIIEEQGKPPDFVLEIASKHTGDTDTGKKRDGYAALGIPEYWRFDQTGEYHGTRLAGDRLVRGRYEPLPIEECPGGALQGYSPVLNLNLRWENGQLRWHDPATGEHIATILSERAGRIREGARANREQARAEQEREGRIREQARADAERQARLAAEARVQELERILSQQNP